MLHVEKYLCHLMYGVLAIKPLTYHQCLETVGASGLSMSTDSSFPVPNNNLMLSSWDQKIDPVHQVGNLESLNSEADELWCREIFRDSYFGYTPLPTTPVTVTVDDSFCNCIYGPLVWDEQAGGSRCTRCGMLCWCPWV